MNQSRIERCYICKRRRKIVLFVPIKSEETLTELKITRVPVCKECEKSMGRRLRPREITTIITPEAEVTAISIGGIKNESK